MVQSKAEVQEFPAIGRDSLWISWMGLRILYYVHNTFGIVAELGPGRFRSQHFEHATTKTPDVCWLRMTGFLYYFRSHPVWRALDWLGQLLKICGFAWTRLEVVVYNSFWCPEIWQLYNSFVINQHIRALQISVDDPMLMQVRQSLQHLMRINLDQAFIKRDKLIQQLPNRPPRNIFQY